MIGSIQVDTSGFIASIRQLGKKAENSKKLSALDIGYEIMRLSQQEVPHDKGSLQNSGNVEQIGDDVIVGYHEPYAARLHEHPEYRFQKGRKGKYLEDPINRNANVLGIRFSKSFGDNL